MCRAYFCNGTIVWGQGLARFQYPNFNGSFTSIGIPMTSWAEQLMRIESLYSVVSKVRISHMSCPDVHLCIWKHVKILLVAQLYSDRKYMRLGRNKRGSDEK